MFEWHVWFKAAKLLHVKSAKPCDGTVNPPLERISRYPLWSLTLSEISVCLQDSHFERFLNFFAILYPAISVATSQLLCVIEASMIWSLFSSRYREKDSLKLFFPEIYPSFERSNFQNSLRVVGFAETNEKSATTHLSVLGKPPLDRITLETTLEDSGSMQMMFAV